MITDTTHKVIWRWDNDPFGTALANEDPDGDGKTFTYNLRFPGQYFDKETGLHYNYFRDYDPATGRYVQSDPIGLEGGLNPYAYVLNNPLKYTDPKGLSAVGVGVGVAVFCARFPAACIAGAVAVCRLVGACSTSGDDNVTTGSWPVSKTNTDSKQCDDSDDFCSRNAQRLNVERNFLISAQALIIGRRDPEGEVALNNDILKFNLEVASHNKQCSLKVLPLRTLGQQGLR